MKNLLLVLQPLQERQVIQMLKPQGLVLIVLLVSFVVVHELKDYLLIFDQQQ
jgi:hypothetical protein